MKLEILRCVGENGETCESSPKYRIEGLGEFCRKHGERQFFKQNIDTVTTTTKPAPLKSAERG